MEEEEAGIVKHLVFIALLLKVHAICAVLTSPAAAS